MTPHTAKALFAAALITTAGCAGTDEPPNEKKIFSGEPELFQLSKTGNDAFYGAAYDASGRLLAVGFSADGVDAASDSSMVVARFTKDGELDSTFGADGIVKKNVKVGGNGEVARSVVIQSTGKIVVGGNIEGGTEPGDRDVALVRFNDDGTVDASFGTDGVVVLDLNTGLVDNGKLVSADNLWNLALSGDKIVVHGNQRADGVTAEGDPRADTDWVLVRLNADGAIDTTFGIDGKFTLDLEEVSGNARTALVLDDGSIIGSGYASTPSLGKKQPVVYKVDSTGKLDTSFGVDGVFHDIVLPELTEVYALARQGDKFVSAGYGRASGSESVDMVSLRFNADGTLDESWGTNGAVQVDWDGFTDKARKVAALEDGRFVIVGGGGTDATNSDGMVALLTHAGKLDATFGETGKKIWDLGGLADMFWDVVVSPVDGTVAVVGVKSVGGDGPTAENNDDAAVLFLTLDL